MCTSGEGSDPESLLEVFLDSRNITGMPRQSIDHYIIDVSLSSNSYGLFSRLFCLNLSQNITSVPCS